MVGHAAKEYPKVGSVVSHNEEDDNIIIITILIIYILLPLSKILNNSNTSWPRLLLQPDVTVRVLRYDNCEDNLRLQT